MQNAEEQQLLRYVVSLEKVGICRNLVWSKERKKKKGLKNRIWVFGVGVAVEQRRKRKNRQEGSKVVEEVNNRGQRKRMEQTRF